MKKLFTLLASTVLMLGLIACNPEPKHELWKQYQSAEDPSMLFPDVSVEEMVLSEVKINGVEVSTKHSSYMAMKEVGLPIIQARLFLNMKIWPETILVLSKTFPA